MCENVGGSFSIWGIASFWKTRHNPIKPDGRQDTGLPVTERFYFAEQFLLCTVHLIYGGQRIRPSEGRIPH